jgi:hypothetical protein
MREKYPHLFQFFGGYFHEDWPLESPLWQDAVALFVKESKPETVLAVYDEVTALRSETVDDKVLGRALFDLGSCYTPLPDGMSNSEWLQEIQKQLAQSFPISAS